MGLKNFAIGMFVGILLVGCAGLMPHYYDLEAASYDGTLLGPEPKDDLPLSVCAPGEQIKHPCVVMKTADFLALKQDYLETKQALKDCQSGK